MNITTTHKTNSKGAVIEARAGDRRKTTTYDPALSDDVNHGFAAGEFIIAKVPETADSVVHCIDTGSVKHEVIASGKHRFVF